MSTDKEEEKTHTNKIPKQVNNSIQFFINVPRQQPQGQLQTQHSVNKVITI
jgi:hypothetical protein